MKYKVYSTGGKEEWVEKGNYWYIKIDYKTKSGATKYWRISYHDTYSGSYSRYNTSSILIENSSSSGNWVSGIHEDTRNLIIGWNSNDGMVIMGYNGKSSETTISDAASITWVTIGLGPSAYINASLELDKESDYSRAKQYLEEAASQMQAGNYNGAANTLTWVIDNLNYNSAYLLRGYAYTQLEYFKTALEDFNKAVSYASDKEERETAYYYRGICKLFLEDLSGAVNDLRNAGQQGKVVLNEYDLETQLSRPNTQRNVRKPSNRTMSKPALTK